MRELPPNGHLLFAFRKDNMSWPSVLAELIDNAFDEAAGNAGRAIIRIDKSLVSVKDDGIGIDDINRLGTLGDSLSYSHEGNLGQHGVGAKAWMKKADRFIVETTRDGRHHKHTFDVTKLGPGGWLIGYEGKGNKTTGGVRSGSTVTLAALKPGKPIVVSAVVNELQRIYWPALIGGREIEIVDDRRSLSSVTSLQAMAPPNWGDRIEFESSVNGRPYRATVGILSESVGAYSGLFIGYLFRNICVVKSTSERALPIRIHGQIELSSAWRLTLSEYKDDITEDKDELLLDIQQKAASVIALADEYQEEVRLLGIASDLERIMARKCAAGTIRGVGIHHRHGPRRPDPQPPGPAEPSVAQQTNTKEVPTEEAPEQARGFVIFAFAHLGNGTTTEVRRDGHSIRITFNQDCPKIAEMTKAPRRQMLLYAAGEALAFYCWDLDAREIERTFGTMLGVSKGTENKRDMINDVRVFCAFNHGEDE